MTEYCSFCAEDISKRECAVSGPQPGLYICSSCIDICQQYIAEHRNSTKDQEPKND